MLKTLTFVSQIGVTQLTLTPHFTSHVIENRYSVHQLIKKLWHYISNLSYTIISKLQSCVFNMSGFSCEFSRWLSCYSDYSDIMWLEPWRHNDTDTPGCALLRHTAKSAKWSPLCRIQTRQTEQIQLMIYFSRGKTQTGGQAATSGGLPFSPIP